MHGADIWVKSLVERIGPENLHVISYVRSQHFGRVFSDFVFEALLKPAGVPRKNIHFAVPGRDTGARARIAWAQAQRLY